MSIFLASNFTKVRYDANKLLEFTITKESDNISELNPHFVPFNSTTDIGLFLLPKLLICFQISFKLI